VISRANAVEKPRDTVWVAPRATRFGANAPAPAAATEHRPESSNSFRRPRRSAMLAIRSEPSTPTRTAARVALCCVRVASNSSAANVMVWVMSVPRYPASSDRVQSTARMVDERALKRWGGAQNGSAPGSGDRSR
jgi:hypothetical protein